MKPEVLKVDVVSEVERIVSTIRHQVFKIIKRKGAVVGLSGGIDSSVVAALAVKALGKDRVAGLLMPEAESSPESLRLSRVMADRLEIETILEDITPVLEAAGCYRRRDEAV